MKVFATYFVLLIGLISCNLMSPSSVKGVNPSEQAIPSQVNPVPSIVPTPIASKGTVIGTLVSTIPGQSLAGLALYFGTILPLTPGPDHLINMDMVNSPKTTINEDGRFIAENLTPGKYVLILWTPIESRFVPDIKNSGQEFIVDVVGGKIVNIGTLTAPPLP